MKKKEQSSGRGIGGRLANQNTNQTFIELSCRTTSHVKMQPIASETRPNGHITSIKCIFVFCLLFAKPNRYYQPLQSINKKRDDIAEKEEGNANREGGCISCFRELRS